MEMVVINIEIRARKTKANIETKVKLKVNHKLYQSSFVTDYLKHNLNIT